MTLGNVYDMDLKKNEALIKEVIIQAQGEVGLSMGEVSVAGADHFIQMALEEYIKTVKETWSNYTLDLVNYQNKCRLIRYVAEIVRRLLDVHIFVGDGMIYSISAAKT